jgi:hypothetical protein
MIGLSTGVKSGKLAINFSGKPKFIDALIFTIAAQRILTLL